jgi:hypothetical protein
MVGGDPGLDTRVTPYHGFVHCASIDNYGAYMFSGTAAQLTALAALPAAQFVPICAVTKSGDLKWAELDGIIASGVRTKLNTWLSNRGLPTIPAGWTYRQTVLAIFRRLHTNFDLDNFYVVAPEDVTGPPAMPEGAGPLPVPFNPTVEAEPRLGKCGHCGVPVFDIGMCPHCGAPIPASIAKPRQFRKGRKVK